MSFPIGFFTLAKFYLNLQTLITLKIYQSAFCIFHSSYSLRFGILNFFKSFIYLNFNVKNMCTKFRPLNEYRNTAWDLFRNIDVSKYQKNLRYTCKCIELILKDVKSIYIEV